MGNAAALAMKKSPVFLLPEQIADDQMNRAETQCLRELCGRLEGKKPEGTFADGRWTPHPAHFGHGDDQTLRQELTRDDAANYTTFNAHHHCKQLAHAWALAEGFFAGREIPPGAKAIAESIDYGKIRAEYAEKATKKIAANELAREKAEREAQQAAHAKTPAGRAEARAKNADARLERLHKSLKKIETQRRATLKRIKKLEAVKRRAEKILGGGNG